MSLSIYLSSDTSHLQILAKPPSIHYAIMNIANSTQKSKNILIVATIVVLMLSSSGFLNLMANPIRNHRQTTQNCVVQAPPSEFRFDGQSTTTAKCDETSSSWFAIRYTLWGAVSSVMRVVGRMLPIALVALMVVAALSRLRSARTIDVMQEREAELKQQLDDELKRE